MKRYLKPSTNNCRPAESEFQESEKGPALLQRDIR
jgi:hypothetical protein